MRFEFVCVSVLFFDRSTYESIQSHAPKIYKILLVGEVFPLKLFWLFSQIEMCSLLNVLTLRKYLRNKSRGYELQRLVPIT